MSGSRLRLITASSAVAVVCLALSGGVGAQRGGDQRGDQRCDQRDTMGGVGITIFAEPDCHGINSNFTKEESDLRRVNMNDRVDSLHIARGEVWEVFENINYKGRSQVFTGDVPDLGKLGWGGMISSLRKIQDSNRRSNYPPPPVQRFRARIVLYDRVGFEGRSVAITDTSATLGSWGNRTGSVKVYGGTWELCDGDRFRGRCETVTDNMADLGRIGLRDKVSSVRPVVRR